MSSSSSSLSGGSPLTADHHEAIAKIATGLCITVSFLSLVLRMLSRWPWRELFDKDDIVAISTLVSALVDAD